MMERPLSAGLTRTRPWWGFRTEDGMAHAQHIGFEREEAGTAAGFAAIAPSTLYIDALCRLFADALNDEGVSGYMCCVVEDGAVSPLVGDDLALGGNRVERDHLAFEADGPDDSLLLVRLAINGPVQPGRRARLHCLAALFAVHALPLIEAADESRGDNVLSDREATCLRLAMAGQPYPAIGDIMSLSAPAVGVVIRRAADRLGASSFAEAAGIAAQRNLLA